MRFLLAAIVIVMTSVPPAEAARARDGFGAVSRCHCDRYLNPRYTARSSRGYRGGSYRSY